MLGGLPIAIGLLVDFLVMRGSLAVGLEVVGGGSKKTSLRTRVHKQVEEDSTHFQLSMPWQEL